MTRQLVLPAAMEKSHTKVQNGWPGINIYQLQGRGFTPEHQGLLPLDSTEGFVPQAGYRLAFHACHAHHRSVTF